MDIFTSTLLVIGAIAILVATGAIIVLVGLKRRRENTSSSKIADKTGAKGGITEKVKETLAKRPSWLVTLATVSGGWLFLLFSVYVLLPPMWLWLAAHPELLWMTPLAIFAAQVLRASKKKPAEYLAYAIILVLLIAFVKAVPWGSGSESAETRRAEEQARLAAATRWQNCIAIPANPALRTSRTILSAPAGNESPCYLIQEGYIGRISPTSPRAHVRLVWQNGRIVDMAEETTNVLPGINSTRDIAFVAMSLGEKPANISVRLEKR